MDKTITWLITAAIIIVSCCSAVSSLSRNPYLGNYQPSPDRYNYFDAELLEVLCRERGNVVISPLSIKLVLGMLMHGAGGKSAEEIEGALRIFNADTVLRQELKQKLFSIQKNAVPDNLRIANRIFASEKLQVSPAYASFLMQNYGSDVAQVRFSHPKKTAELLNSWVAGVTSGKIRTLTDESQISSNAKLIMANAIYFKGMWQTPFSTQKTVTKCFYTRPEKCTMVPLMTDSGFYDFGYVAKLDAYTINLPYEGGQFSMILVLPNKRHGHIQLSRDMIHVSLDEILLHMKKEKMEVEIPRFTAEFNKDLVKDLEKLHISHVFSNNANLTGFLPGMYENASVTNVFHSAKIEVDEQGTVAAASTGVLFVALMGDTKKYFIADHPFLFFIRDTRTGTVLFSGKIEQPQEVQEERGLVTLTGYKSMREESPISQHTVGTNHYRLSSNSPRIYQKPQWYPIQYRSPSWNQDIMTLYNSNNGRV